MTRIGWNRSLTWTGSKGAHWYIRGTIQSRWCPHRWRWSRILNLRLRRLWCCFSNICRHGRDIIVVGRVAVANDGVNRSWADHLIRCCLNRRIHSCKCTGNLFAHNGFSDYLNKKSIRLFLFQVQIKYEHKDSARIIRVYRIIARPLIAFLYLPIRNGVICCVCCICNSDICS